jgi:integrase
VKNIGASAAVDKFTAAKERQGVDVRCSYNKVLPHFSKRFADTRLDTISTTMLSEWLDRDFAHPLTRNTVRKRVVTLFRWARKQGYLPKDSRTEIEDTESARTAPMKIGIITADQLGVAFEKIREKAPRYVPALILAAHCGLRRSEVHGQSWADIRLDNKILRVTSAKRNTPAKRLVPISDSAVRSLREFESKGALCSNLAIDRIRDICITGGLDLPPNCFRHSFITYRCALTGDIPRTSMEAGNSSRVIHQYYRELATEEEGREYFETFTPETA